MIEITKELPPAWRKLVEEAPKEAIQIWRSIGRDRVGSPRNAYIGDDKQGAYFVVVTQIEQRADGKGIAEVMQSISTPYQWREAQKCVFDSLGRDARRIL